ncbi:hypothetical protein GCM10023189_57140 [Nibrella saemangeumensis]|uniref:Transporter, SSS family n=1 Tax=Nibrella saemangeumensis TaxID=1084526 RepID=A0ABP8NR61_9BACT
MNSLDLSVLVVYFLMMLVIGVLFNRSGTDTRSFFAAGGEVPWWISGLSLYMSFFSAGVFVVWGSIAYQQGLVAIAIQWTMCIAGFVVAFWIAPRWKRANILTAAEYIGERFGTPLQQVYIYLFMIIGIIVAGAVLYPVARMLEVATDLSLFWSILLLGGIIILYTALGGLWAVLVTDVLQFVILTATVVLTVPLSLMEVGGLSGFLDKLPDTHRSLTSSEYTPLFMVSFILVHIFKIGGDWTYIQRFTSVRNEAAARRTGLLFGGLYILSPVFWMIPPMAYFILNGTLDKQGAETAYIQMCQRVLPVGMLGMMLAAMVSATASSANTILNMCAAVFTNDLYRKLIRPDSSDRSLMRIARLSTVGFGILMIVIADSVPRIGGVVALVFSINALTYVPLLAPPVWALFSSRLDRRGMYLSIGGGLLVNLFFKFVTPSWMGLSLNRTEETVIGLIVTPLILIAYEWIKYKSSTFEGTWCPAATPLSSLEPETRGSSMTTNSYGIRVVAWTFMCTGLGFTILSILTTAHHWYVAFLGAGILLLGAAILRFNLKQHKQHQTSENYESSKSAPVN